MIKPNLLITGCTGFVGRNLLSSEYFQSFNLYCLIRTAEQGNDLKRIRNDLNFIRIEELNLSFNGLEIYACIHLAAYGVNPDQNNYVEFVNTNILLTMKLYEFSKKSGCKIFINIGSVFEYGEQSADLLITEGTIPSPNSLYGATKYSAHLLLNTLQKNMSLKFITIRPFGLFGKFESMNRLYPQVIKTGLKQIPLKLTSGNQIRNIVFVIDFVKFLKLIVENQEKLNVEVINFTNSTPISVKEFVNRIIHKLSFNPSLFQFGILPYRKNESMVYIGDNQRMKLLFNNFKFTSLESAIDESFDYYK